MSTLSGAALISERDRMAVCLKAIVDCYGMGQSPERFCKNVHDFIMEGRQILADSGHAMARHDEKGAS